MLDEGTWTPKTGIYPVLEKDWAVFGHKSGQAGSGGEANEGGGRMSWDGPLHRFMKILRLREHYRRERSK